MRLCLPLVAALVIASGADVADDLRGAGVPADSAAVLGDTTLVVYMSGTLAEGDSLLKHYGGVFFTLVDSIATGWDPLGVTIRIPEARLVLRRDDMVAAIDMIVRDGEAGVADWILGNTRVFRD